MENLLKDKRGESSFISGAMLAVVLTVIVAVTGMIIAQELADSIDWEDEWQLTENETLNSVNESGVLLANIYCNPSSIVAYNATDGDVINAANYTVTCSRLGSYIYYSAADDDNYNNTDDWNISYGYYPQPENWQGINESINGLGKFGDFVPIIAIAVVMVLVFGLLLNLGRKSM